MRPKGRTRRFGRGQIGECVGGIRPSDELCNGIDDNCNGSIDENFPEVGQPCERRKGECATNGVNQCSDDGSAIKCDAPEPVGEPELCDGIDNDCDSNVDEIFMRLGQPWPNS